MIFQSYSVSIVFKNYSAVHLVVIIIFLKNKYFKKKGVQKIDEVFIHLLDNNPLLYHNQLNRNLYQLYKSNI